MSNDKSDSKRWMEITSATYTETYATQAETANNIPLLTSEESKNLALRSSRLAHTVVAPPLQTMTTTTAGTTTTTTSNKDGTEKCSDVDSARVVQRVTARPGRIQTQIAKISYTYKDDKIPKLAKQSVKPVTVTTLVQHLCQQSSTSSTSPCQKQTDDEKKKTHREEEMLELNGILKEVTTNAYHVKEPSGSVRTLITTSHKQLSNEAAKENIPLIVYEAPEQSDSAGSSSPTYFKTSFQRSKTDFNLISTNRTETHRRNSERVVPNKSRSKSNHLPASKFSEAGSSPEKKVTSRNREETLRFMEEQRKKRSLEAFNTYRSQIQSAKEKEQIKQRLELLRKQSRRIISKNIQNKQANAQKRTDVAEGLHLRKTAKMDFKPKNTQETQTKINTETSTNQIKSQFQGTKTNDTEMAKEQKNSVQEGSDIQRGGKDKTSNALIDNQKRIGLLRKPEIKDHSFSAIKEFNFDQENAVLKSLMPNLSTHQDGDLSAGNKNIVPPFIPQIRDSVIDEEQQQQQQLQAKGQRSDESKGMPKEQIFPKNEKQQATQNASQKTNAIQRPEQSHSCRSSTYDLEVPSAYLKISAALHEQATPVNDSPSLIAVNRNEQLEKNIIQGDNMASNELNELPFWLRPSAVQIYPFNFIMAVRRKLEAIVNPPQITVTTWSVTKTENKTTYTLAENEEMSLPIKITELPSCSRRSPQKFFCSTNSDEDTDSKGGSCTSCKTHIIHKTSDRKIPEHLSNKRNWDYELLEKNRPARSDTGSNFTTNFSSISLELIASHNGSEISHKKSLSQANSQSDNIKSETIDDATTISSSVFNSPEKKCSRLGLDNVESFKTQLQSSVSPLSMDHIDNLKISSKKSSTTTSISKHSSNATTSSRHIKNNQENPININEVEVDFNSLLQDFNRSLSQVIEVNQQLKTTIDKSNKMFSMETKQKCGDSNEEEYSTDFESASTSLTNDVAEEQIAKTEVKKSPNKKLFKLNSVVPFYSISDDESNGSSKRNEQINLNLDLDLNDTSGESTKSSSTSPQNTSSVVGPERHGKDGTAKHASAGKTFAIEEKNVNVKENGRSNIANIKKLKHNIKILHKCDLNEDKNHSEILQILDKSDKNIEQTCKEIKERKEGEREDFQCLYLLNERNSKKEKPCSKNNPADGNKVDEYNKKQISHSDDESISLQSPCPSDTVTIRSSTNVEQSASNSPTSNKKSSKAKISLDFGDESISEELECEKQMESNRSNESVYNKELAKSSPKTNSKSGTPRKSHHGNRMIPENQRYINSHINRSRGDFILNENHTSSEFKRNISSFRSDDIFDSNSPKTGLTVPPPSYAAAGLKPKLTPLTKSHSKKINLNASEEPLASGAGGRREYVTVFNHSDLEVSIISSQNGDSLSETSLNYSSVGLYEKLIQNETTKSEHLTALLKMREKALIDRTKGQIAWLEVQKERYKQRGLLTQIAAIKKKQRGILMKMEKEREGIKRLLQTTNSISSTHSSSRAIHQSVKHQQITSLKRAHDDLRKTPPVLPPPPLVSRSSRSSGIAKQHQRKHFNASSTSHSAHIVKATYDLESSHILEDLLQRREADLRRRREHVERLVLWHQRLDQEEEEVQQLEHMLLNCNYTHAHAQQLSKGDNNTPAMSLQQRTPKSKIAESKKSLSSSDDHIGTTIEEIHKHNLPRGAREAKMERRLKEIDRSLRELSSISINKNSATSADDSSPSENDYVRTSGSKLNKLWRRLTMQHEDRFDSTRRYKLCKADLERLYEEAKISVLRDFSRDGERVKVELLDKSTVTPSRSQSRSPTSRPQSENCVHVPPKIPNLTLNFSSEHSEPEDETVLDLAEKEQKESDHQESLVHTPKIIVTPPISDAYSPSVAEEIAQNISPSQSTSLSSQSKGDGPHNLEMSNLSTEERRETILQRNVQKFMKLTQRFNAQQSTDGTGLQRSLSDTQIADNSYSVFNNRSAKNSSSNVPQRNIAYYGHKTQKRPSASVNNEIASSLSNASSILTAVSAMHCINTDLSSPQMKSTVCADPVVQSSSDIKVPIRIEETVFIAENNIPLSPHLSAVDSSENNEENIAYSNSSNSSITESIKSVSPDSKMDVTFITSKSSGTETEDLIYASETPEDHEDDNSSSNIKEHCYNSLTSSVTPTTPDSPQFSTKKSFAEPNEIGSETFSYSYTFEEDQSQTEVSSSNRSSHCISSTDNNCHPNVFQSTTFQSRVPEVDSNLLLENLALNNPKDNFEDIVDYVDEIRLEDLSLPQFETTIETSQCEDDTDDENTNSNEVRAMTELLVDKKDEHSPMATNNILSPTSKSLPPPPAQPLSSSSTTMTTTTHMLLQAPPPPPPTPQIPSTSKDITTPTSAFSSSTSTSMSNSPTSQHNQQHLMPDIINELEQRRCQQPSQQYEHVAAIPYNMYVREIPNKPPPPYVPPAHGSPMTTIFPAEERIKDLTYRRTHELYCEMLKTEYTNDVGEKLPSVLAEKITNIYERIILDICREYLEEHKNVVTKADPNTFHSPLAFFNPPNRLACLQKFVYKEVRRCLAMDKSQPKRTQVYSVYGQRAKRDHIGQIIIQEMYDEDDKWCNFHREEIEVMDLIIEEMIKNEINNLARKILVEEGGCLEEPNDSGTIKETEVVEHKTGSCRTEEQQQQQTETISAMSSSTNIIKSSKDDPIAMNSNTNITAPAESQAL